MTNITIPAADLQVLLDIAEGYTSENGLDSVGRYAMPEGSATSHRQCQNRSTQSRSIERLLGLPLSIARNHRHSRFHFPTLCTIPPSRRTVNADRAFTA